ncbi:MAG: TonB-dependent receptor [candidate division KSB1 bacterium]|nr:TonB-dependent receptor [candidate division KSB1 bacterium]MDZ7358033.1 TonB-dependent receptor [candidate division KSB1 bacterium]MDZ7401083.1 TonB-dependent receptor [candidate division KSB1 bacterium]
MRKQGYQLLLIVAILVSPILIFGQGSVRGVISDAANSKPLVGANVFIVGTSLGSATDVEGVYRIMRVPVGRYTLRVTYIGYQPKDIEIEVQQNRTLEVNVALIYDIIRGKLVEVTAQAEGQVAAINKQISSNTIVNIVSEEKIQELPDANAAEAIGRLPGVSIIRSGGEANKVILRGLEDKFTNITIDGVKIPPTDATSRGVDLSTLSQSSLAGIELYKATTPDKDGDALAGSINLVTKKAPDSRRFRLDLKGDYNRLMNSADQYDLSLRYGERFFNKLLGIQLAGNFERRIRSNERINVNYNQDPKRSQAGYFIDDFLLEFTDEIRKRDGLSLFLDLDTPDKGTIRFNTVYGRTKRDYLWSTRDYPSNGGGNQEGNPVYDYRDREQEIYTLNSSLRGDNTLLGLKVNWGVSLGQSEAKYPFDYEAIFVEPSGMLPSPMVQSNPAQLIDYAVNNFANASMYWAYYRSQHNFDKERTAFLDIGAPYLLANKVSGELKFGGKYKIKDRTNERGEDFTPYYLGKWQPYELLPDGTFQKKDFTGTYFEDWLKAGGGFIAINQFFSKPTSRSVYGSYQLTPLVERARLRQWWQLNRYGIDATGNQREVWPNPLIRYDDYDITERVTAGYLMNTLNLGRKLTIIAGVRIEYEDNDYIASYMPKPVAGFPVPANSIRDTTSAADQTVVLPNLNIAYSPFDFMKLRLAAYKALARPDFNMRLDRYIAGRPAEVGTQFQVYVGNPRLKTAQAWNFEANTSFFGRSLGLISISGYYKEIQDMYHMLNRFNTVGDSLLRFFGIRWASQMKTTPYNLTLPYNSPKPAKVWGIEFEHQINFHFLPGLLKHLVLSYNASLVRSEAVLYGSRTITYIDSSGLFPLIKSKNILIERKQKLEGMPEFFGNIALGYDIGNFSGRISLFHQGEHNVSYSASGLSDEVTNAFTRVDVALRQKITNSITLVLNLSNLTNVEDGSSIYNRVYDRRLFNESEKYGMTADFGVIVQF